jgi:RNase P subunit RPR2
MAGLKIEVLKLKYEEDESLTVLDDDLIEYIEDPQFVEYEYIEGYDAEKWSFNQESIKTDDNEEFKTEDKNLIIKLESDLQYHDQRDEIYKCSNRKCKRENIFFPTQQELDAHNSSMHVLQINCNICPICNKTLASASKLHIHMETRHIPKNFYCDHCSKVFKSKDNLRLHMSHHRKHFLVECKACKKAYKSMQSLRYHLRQHFEHHQCETCGKVRNL